MLLVGCEVENVFGRCSAFPEGAAVCGKESPAPGEEVIKDCCFLMGVLVVGAVAQM